MRIQDLPHDKALHFSAGAIAACGGVLLAALVEHAGYRAGPVWPCIGACGAAGVLREAWNQRQGGFFDWRDIGATLAGGLPVLLSLLVTAH